MVSDINIVEQDINPTDPIAKKRCQGDTEGIHGGHPW
jgi:hypothetical protein